MIQRCLLISLVALAACKGGQRTRGPVDPPVQAEAPRPDWVRSRPSSGSYYIGVGLASKGRSDHQETAKKNALNDLASEISVTVEGNSLLYTLDRKYQFDESFTSTIRTTTNELIEGFELVDSWENGTEFWTYYRLSKAEHARLKAERKAKAIGTALDLHQRSRASIDAGDLKGAIDQDLRALIAMKAYWGENDMVAIDGRQAPLVNEVFAHLQALTSGVRLSILPERCELSHTNHYRREMLVSARHQLNGGGRDLPQLPLRLEYPGLSGKVVELKNTDAESRLRSLVQKVAIEAPGEFMVRLDMDALVSKELDQALVNVLLKSLTVPEARAPIDLRMPRVLMRALETNLGQPLSDAGVGVVFREELTRKGFRMVDREAEADLLLNLNASTRQGGEASGFFTSYLDVTYAFRDRKTGEVVHEGVKQGVKGVQLDYPRAGLDAYKKAAQEIRKDLMPGMINALF